MRTRKFIITCCLTITLYYTAKTQETNSDFSGKVRTSLSVMLPNASVTLTHEPTKSKVITLTRADGYFSFFNLKPGGPYTLEISHAGYETIKKADLFFNLIAEPQDFEINSRDIILLEKTNFLPEVKIQTNINNTHYPALSTQISSDQLQALPSIARNFHDYIRIVPQAVITRDGGISLAGQNNRFNAFFIDGANNNDILGLAASGTNGGQTGTPPISMEALEQISIVLAPYDVQYSNFTGGSINAITRSGSNNFKAAAWYYFRNEYLAGSSPLSIENPSAPGVFERPRLSHFFNQTTGLRAGGPIVKNKLFYFFLAETQSELRPQPVNLSEYRGSATAQQLTALSELLRSRYQYDPGNFLETNDILTANRFVARVDWTASTKNKFTISLRYNTAKRTALNGLSSSTQLSFSNSGLALPATSYSSTFEWKRFFSGGPTNRLLISITSELEDRKWMGRSFPRVSIADGPANILFGSAPGSGLTLYKGKNIAISNVFKNTWKSHSITSGVDLSYNKISDWNIPNFFGTYQFRNLEDFVTGAKPIRYQRSFSLLDLPVGDKTLAGSIYSTFQAGIFFNDNFRIDSKFNLNFGIRFDNNFLPTHTYIDKFFNDTAINTISKYYDLEGTRAGIYLNSQWQVSPRFGFSYKFPAQKILVQGGAGIFRGHILNVWTDVLYSRNGMSIGSLDINPQAYGLNFNSDPYNQPTPQSLGIDINNAKGELDLISKKFKYPSVLKSSITVLKKIPKNWALSVEAIFTSNIFETKYTNLNILPAEKTSLGPGGRNVYSTGTNPVFMPLRSNGINPYPGQVFLLSNNKGKKGYSYGITYMIDKHWTNNFSINTSYTIGKSKVLFEPSFNNSLYSTQWRLTESVNGKNNMKLSASDVGIGHRVTATVIKKFTYIKNKTLTTFSIFYNGQSGSPYSYVYNGSIVNDDGNKQNLDLIYIPTTADLSNMIFVPITVGTTTLYTADQQKSLLDQFVESDKYLRKNRGEFAERNGARLPFTNMVDLRLQQDFKIKRKGKILAISINYDVFNFLNMLNRSWGRLNNIPADNYPLIRFAGFVANSLTPQYQFSPIMGNLYSLQPSTAPGYSARWISQLGFKITLD